MDATTLCLVRHGETAWNAERRIQGHLDIGLNDTGRAQARATATGLAGERFAAIYCSDLGRARDTASAAAERLTLQPVPMPSLRERHYGAFQGLTYEEARARFPDQYLRFAARDPAFAFSEGGESLETFRTRIAAALEAIARRHAGTRVLVVTHGGVLDIAFRLATGRSLDAPRDFEIPNAALNWIAFEDGRWRLLDWADRRHLAATRDDLPDA